MRVWLMLLVACLGCAGERSASYAPTADDAPLAAGLAGSDGETKVATGNDRQHPRRIIYTATVDVVVEDFGDVPAKIAQLAERFGGYVAGSSIHGQPGRPRQGTWTIRVPVEQYEQLLADARQLGELRSLTSKSSDVSEEYYDIEARIRNKQKTETRLVALLEEATGNLEQVLKVEQSLDKVREELERMQGRLRVLADQTSLATITITVEQIAGYQAPDEPTYGKRVTRAFQASLRALITTAARVSIMIVALAPWLAVLLVLGLILCLLVRALRRIRRRPRNTPTRSDVRV